MTIPSSLMWLGVLLGVGLIGVLVFQRYRQKKDDSNLNSTFPNASSAVMKIPSTFGGKVSYQALDNQERGI